MSHVPESDPDSLEQVAGQVEAIHEQFKKTKDGVTGVTGENPFGAIKRPDELEPGEHPSEGMVDALGTLRDGVHKQFDAAAELMTSTGGALRDAARALRETDDAARDSLTVRDGSLQV
ncbi:hypothetical protein GCM10027445_44330 [Amycolatopsis endophytica]